jgi:hypothetical protein
MKSVQTTNHVHEATVFLFNFKKTKVKEDGFIGVHWTWKLRTMSSCAPFECRVNGDGQDKTFGFTMM